MGRHREDTNSWLWILPALLVPVVIAAFAWTAHVASEGDEIAPNVRFAGIDISGLQPEDVADLVTEREAEFLATEVVVDLGESSITLTADEAGYDYLYTETLGSAISARHEDGPLAEFISWATTPLDYVTIVDHYELDEDKARSRLSESDFVIEHPVEPVVTSEGDTSLYVVPGVDGVGIDVDSVIADLTDATVESGPILISAEHRVIEPTMSDADAEASAVEMNARTEEGLLAVVGQRTAALTPGEVRRHLMSSADEGEIAFSVDIDGFHAELEAAFDEPIGEITEPELEVVDGRVRVVEEGEPPPICCSRQSVETTAQLLLEGGSSFYYLDTRPDDDAIQVGWADGSFVTEQVATFTTNHPCCENRVTNIQTMADALTGVHLLPGETISLNEFVGPRTREKGYLPAGAIRGGYMTDEVGGGVSQFVTTIFNAAFFGGLDLDEYQSHSIYFSRYPFGREATLSIPGPDLVLTNSTDYPVLIWPTYDDTSITVSLYSTENVEVEELEQRISRRGQCRSSAIDRQRTFSDGRVEVDTIVAFYRPGDGLDCNGRAIPQR